MKDRAAYQKEWGKNNRDKMRVNARRYRYKTEFGMTMEDWDLMFESQSRSCKICKRTDSGSKNHWATDHDHTTGKVRGILCQPCNNLLGNAHDDPIVLIAAAAYLERKTTYEAINLSHRTGHG